MNIIETKHALHSELAIIGAKESEVWCMAKLLEHQGYSTKLSTGTAYATIIYWPSDNTQTLLDHKII